MPSFEHPPTPPAIPTDAPLSGGTFQLYPETLTFVGVDLAQDSAVVVAKKDGFGNITLVHDSPVPQEPFDPHSMSIGAVSVAALLEDAA